MIRHYAPDLLKDSGSRHASQSQHDFEGIIHKCEFSRRLLTCFLGCQAEIAMSAPLNEILVVPSHCALVEVTSSRHNLIGRTQIDLMRPFRSPWSRTPTWR